ncbi:tyrosine-type recombinase/integrase, partial [Nocardioides sp.]|uniref:tyrosine-type recombinase/integrase n=1 Tax=Nocardioides sp. TaxID=35761 RepID=UPI00273358CE
VVGVSTQTLDAIFRKYRKKAGLSGFTFHDSRHYAATYLARKVDMLTLCKILGWKDPKHALIYYNPTVSMISEMMSRKDGRK